MSLTKDEIATIYPLPVYSYKVDIDGNIMGFSEVSGLKLDYEHQVYKHGYSYTGGYNIVRGRMKPVNITLKKGIIRQQDQLYDLVIKDQNWWAKFFAGKDQYSITIDLCDELGIPVVRWKVRNAIPLSLEAPTFDSNSNDVAIESMVFISHDLEVEYV